MRMWKRLHPSYNLYRRFFGRYTLDDPRPIAARAKYTYFLPSQWQLEHLQVGDLAQLIFRSHPPGVKWGAERMWVEIISVDGGLCGRLTNQPFDMPQLSPGARVRFESYHVISTDCTDESAQPERREYWERCLVDKCVSDGDVPAYYLYREDPDEPQDGEKFPDSGWRIRGDFRALSDEELDAREVEYVALGRVLNADDSWLHLIDSPVGSAFRRNFDTGEYEPYERDVDDCG